MRTKNRTTSHSMFLAVVYGFLGLAFGPAGVGVTLLFVAAVLGNRAQYEWGRKLLFAMLATALAAKYLIAIVWAVFWIAMMFEASAQGFVALCIGGFVLLPWMSFEMEILTTLSEQRFGPTRWQRIERALPVGAHELV